MRKPHNFKWNEGAIRKAASTFSTRSEFERHEASAVNAARQRHPGLLDELFPRKLRAAWDEASVREEAKKYKSKKDFQENSTAEPVARKLGILDDLGFTRPKNHRFKWTEEAIREEAKKYSTKREFERFSRGASERARVIGIIDTLGLKEYPPSDNNVLYIWRALGQFFNGDPVYKVGVTSARLGAARLKSVSKASGFELEVVCFENLKVKASQVERQILKLGSDPKYLGFNGASEFRAFNASALNAAMQIICINT